MSKSIERKPSTFFTSNSKGEPTLWESLGTDREGREMIRTSVSGSRGKVYDAEKTIPGKERSWVTGRRAARSDASSAERAREAFCLWPIGGPQDARTGDTAQSGEADKWSSIGNEGVYPPPNDPPASGSSQQRSGTVRFSEPPSTTFGHPSIADNRTTRQAPRDFAPAATQNSGRALGSRYSARDDSGPSSKKWSKPPPPPSSPISTAGPSIVPTGSLARGVSLIPVPQLSTKGKGPSTSDNSGANMVPSMDRARPSVDPQKMFGDPNNPTRVPAGLPSIHPQASRDRRPRQTGVTGSSDSFPPRSGFNNLPNDLSRPYLATGPTVSDKTNYPPAPPLAYRTAARFGAAADSSTGGTHGSSGGGSYIGGRPVSDGEPVETRYPHSDQAVVGEDEAENEEEEGEEIESASENESGSDE